MYPVKRVFLVKDIFWRVYEISDFRIALLEVVYLNLIAANLPFKGITKPLLRHYSEDFTTLVIVKIVYSSQLFLILMLKVPHSK